MPSKTRRTCRTSASRKITIIILTGLLISVVMVLSVIGQTESMNETIRMTVILFRHGEKYPTSFFPHDDYADLSIWNAEYGALTERGIRQAYDLGKNLNGRYRRLLSPHNQYSKNNMQVVSSYAERCIMSAQAVLAGLLPINYTRWVLPISWQPAAVTSLPRLQDTLIAQKKPCAKYDKMLSKMYSDPPADLVKLNTENAELYKNLTALTGKEINNVLDVEMVYNFLKFEAEAELLLPSWHKGIYPERLKPLAERSYTLFTDNDYMKRIKGGAFLSEVNKLMIAKSMKKLEPDRKIFLYSGHDVTLVNVMNSLNILDQTAKLPDYASALVFELHSMLYNNQYVVKMVYYENSESLVPKDINIPNCSQPCELNTFTQSIYHLLFEDYDEVCENPKSC